MNYIVMLKMVPDVVEELEIAPDEMSLDTEWLRMIISEPCDHALEQSLLLKEKYGGQVTALALEMPEVDDILYTAMARGVDRAIKVAGEWAGISSPLEAQVYASLFSEGIIDVADGSIILTGSQAIDDLTGEIGAYLANLLDLPYVGVVTGVSVNIEAKTVTLVKEFSGGLLGELEAPYPAVLGIQAAEKPPRYVPVAKIRSAMKSTQYETRDVPSPAVSTRFSIKRMYKKEVTGVAEMLEGSPEDISEHLVDILVQRGIIGGGK